MGAAPPIPLDLLGRRDLRLNRHLGFLHHMMVADNGLGIESLDGLGTGRRTEIDAVSRFSPDGKRFLVQNDNVATDHENNLEIWRRERDGAIIEWAHPYKQVYVEAPVLQNIYHTEVMGWRGDRITLAFSSGKWFDTKKKSVIPARHWLGYLTREASGWHLEAYWPKAN